MGNFSNNAITDVGKMLHADVQAGAVFTPTRIVMGSGMMPSGATTQSMTDVITPVKSLSINKKTRTPDGKCIFGGVYTNEEVTAPFYFRELALYAKAVYLNPDGTVKSEGDEILYSYGNAGETADYMPAYSTSTVVEKQMDLITWVGNDAQVDLTIEGGLYVSQEIFESHASRHAIGGEDPLTPADIGAVNKAGDTMTGDLVISKAISAVKLKTPNGAANFFKNANTENDHGTTISDETVAGITDRVILSTARALTDKLRLVTSDGNSYYFLHTGNKDSIKPADIGAVSKAGDRLTGFLEFKNFGDYFAIIKGRTISTGKTHFLSFGTGADGSTALEHYTCDTAEFDATKRDGRLELNPVFSNGVPRSDALLLRGETLNSQSFRIYGEHYSPAVVATAELI